MHINNSPGCSSPSVIKEKKQPGKIKVARNPWTLPTYLHLERQNLQTQASSEVVLWGSPLPSFLPPLKLHMFLITSHCGLIQWREQLHSCVVCFFFFFLIFPSEQNFQRTTGSWTRDWEVSTHTWEGWGGRYFCMSCALETVGQKTFDGYHSSATYRMDFNTVVCYSLTFGTNEGAQDKSLSADLEFRSPFLPHLSKWNFSLPLLLFGFIYSLTARHVGPQIPNQGWNQRLLHWRCRVLTTGWARKVPYCLWTIVITEKETSPSL